MPPKKGDGKGKKTKKSKANKPPWMSDAMWDLSQNLPKLSEFYSGELKDTKVKEGQQPPPNITRTQAGMFIWQLLFPNNKQGKEKREECIKLGIVETSVKILASGKAPDMTPALGILVAMTSDSLQQRTIMLDAKPSALPNLLGALGDESASLRAAACALLRVVSREVDARPRLWRVMRLSEWDWAPLVHCLDLTDMSQLGGRSACYDAAAAMEALCCAPELDIANGACNGLMAAGGPAHLVRVLRTKNAHPMAKAACVAVLNALLRRSPPEGCEAIAVGQGALEPLAAVFLHPVVPLVYKAHAAACILRYVMPDTLWQATAAAAKAAAAGQPPGSAGGLVDVTPEAAAAAAGGAMTGDLAAAVSRGLESAGTAGGGAGGPREGLGVSGSGVEVPNLDLLDDETREQVVSRARRVAALDGVLRSLVGLCVGPDGPLPDLEAAAAAAAAGEAPAADAKSEKGKKKKGKKGKKKGKPEPGMVEAQTYASAVLRLCSLAEEQRAAIVRAGAVRYLLPLLDAKNSPARWNARQTLINLSMSPALMPTLQLYKVPDYVHGANVPATHFERPAGTSSGAAPAKLEHQDSLGRKRDAVPGKPGLSKPPPLKATAK